VALLAVGNNAAVFASKAALNAAAGRVVSDVARTLRVAAAFKAMLDQYGTSDLESINSTDGTDGSANEIGYLKTAVAAADILNQMMNVVNQANPPALPSGTSLAAQTAYVTGGQN
jgi:hypothetical protein